MALDFFVSLALASSLVFSTPPLLSIVKIRIKKDQMTSQFLCIRVAASLNPAIFITFGVNGFPIDDRYHNEHYFVVYVKLSINLRL